MRFIVLIPTFDNGEMIRPAIESVLAQSHPDFRLIVTADGAPETSLEVIREYVARDHRVALSVHPKGERHGEAHRHEDLSRAASETAAEAVCYLSDDDFWFPDHLETMAGLLEGADFVHTRHVEIRPDLTLLGRVGDLADPEVCSAMRQSAFNFFGLSVAGHRMKAYQTLGEGWAPAPTHVWTDLHMWRKWLAEPAIRFRSSPRITSLHMPRSARRSVDPALLRHEGRTWFEAFLDPSMRVALDRVLPADESSVPLAAVFAQARQGSGAGVFRTSASARLTE